MSEPKEGFWADLFCNVSNIRWELGRILWGVLTIAFVGYQGWAIHNGQEFDPIQFGTGAAAMLAAGGWGIKQKDEAAKA